jgi:hypothetical protein
LDGWDRPGVTERLLVWRGCLVTVFGYLIVPLVLARVVVDDPQDLDEAEGGSQPPHGRLLLGVDLGHGRSRLPLRRIVASGPQVQVDPAALELELVDVALAVVLAARLEGKDL